MYLFVWNLSKRCQHAIDSYLYQNETSQSACLLSSVPFIWYFVQKNSNGLESDNISGYYNRVNSAGYCGSYCEKWSYFEETCFKIISFSFHEALHGKGISTEIDQCEIWLSFIDFWYQIKICILEGKLSSGQNSYLMNDVWVCKSVIEIEIETDGLVCVWPIDLSLWLDPTQYELSFKWIELWYDIGTYRTYTCIWSNILNRWQYLYLSLIHIIFIFHIIFTLSHDCCWADRRVWWRNLWRYIWGLWRCTHSTRIRHIIQTLHCGK